jgi:cytochrome bd-type quinol oxidase subunit 2
VVTQIFLTFVLIASVVGLASVLAGAHHLRVWRGESLAAAAAAATIAWLLTLLAMGVACKQIHTRYGRNKRLKTLEAFMIILSLFELLYLLALHLGKVNRDGYGNAPAGRNVKDPNYGTPAATAV